MENHNLIRYEYLNNFDLRKDNIIFYHIAKTGGTTLNEYFKNLNNHYYELLGHQHWIDFFDDVEKRNKEPYFITGHRCLGAYDYLRGKSIFLTIFRDPLERAISHYKYDMQRGIISKTESLYIFAKKNNFDKYYINLFGNNFNTAKKILDSDIAIFGFTDRYKEFLKIISYYLKIDNLTMQKKTVNNAKSSIKIDKEDIEKVKIFLSEDYKFFNYAKNLYKRRYSKILERETLTNISINESRTGVPTKEKMIQNSNLNIHNGKYHVLANEYEKKEDFKQAEFYFKKFSQYTNDDHLISFYERNNLNEQYIQYIDMQAATLYKYITDVEYSDINKYISKNITNLIYNYIDQKNYKKIIYLVTKYNKILNRSCISSLLINLICKNKLNINVSEEEFLNKIKVYIFSLFGINENQKLAIFGSKKAGNIAYSICKFFNLNVTMFIDDFCDGDIHGIPIIKYENIKNIEKYVDLIIVGPEQKGDIDSRVPSEVKVIKL